MFDFHLLAPDAVMLALFTGLAFGVITTMVGSSWQRLAIMLASLYMLQTFAQQLLRLLQGTGSMDEFITISLYRLTFAVAACAVVAIWARRKDKA